MFLRIIRGVRYRIQMALGPEWKRNPRAVKPADQFRAAVLKDYARRFSLRTLVETGTSFGKTVDATKDDFDRIITIELDPDLAQEAQARFSGWDHIRVLQGDSTDLLPQVLGTIEEPALFWLDAHYSGPPTARGRDETPIAAEIEALVRHPVRDHVILIDDAHSFGQGGYPSISAIEETIARFAPTYAVEVSDNIIRVCPRKADA